MSSTRHKLGKDNIFFNLVCYCALVVGMIAVLGFILTAEAKTYPITTWDMAGIGSVVLETAHSDTQTEKNILLAGDVYSDQWQRDYRREQQREMDRQQRRLDRAARDAERARNRREWNRAQRRAERAQRELDEARMRRDLPLEPIPK
jgi:hypothetical protein